MVARIRCLAIFSKALRLDTENEEAIAGTALDLISRGKLDEAKEGALIQVVDPAIVPDYKSSPKRGLITVAAAIAGMLIGIFAALFKEGMERLRQDPEQSERLNMLRRALWTKKTA